MGSWGFSSPKTCQESKSSTCWDQETKANSNEYQRHGSYQAHSHGEKWQDQRNGLVFVIRNREKIQIQKWREKNQDSKGRNPTDSSVRNGEQGDDNRMLITDNVFHVPSDGFWLSEFECNNSKNRLCQIQARLLCKGTPRSWRTPCLHGGIQQRLYGN